MHTGGLGCGCPRYDQMTGDGSRVGCGRRTCGLLCAARAGSSRQAGGRRYGLILNGPARRPVSHLRRSGRGIPAAERSSTTSGALLGRTARFLFRALARPAPRTRAGPPCDTAATVTTEERDGHRGRARHMSAEEIVALCREALAVRVVGAGRRRPHPGRPRGGRLLLLARRQALPRLQQPADVREHRPRRPAGHRRRHGADAEAGLRQPVHGHRAARPPGRQARRD